MCTPELTERIAALITKGVHPGTAAQACGIARRTFQYWVSHAQEGTEPFTSAIARFEEARALCIADRVQKALAAVDASPNNWPGHFRFLESFARDDYLRESKTITEGTVTHKGSPVTINLVQVDRQPEPLPELIELVEADQVALEANTNAVAVPVSETHTTRDTTNA